MATYSVQFVGYVIQDEFTEYHMKVSSSEGTSWLVRRRYREFRELHDHLKLKYPERIPACPGKKLWGNQDPDFVRQRQDQLQVYMNGILALEPDCRTRVLQRFLEVKKPVSPSSPPSAVPTPAAVQSPAVSAAVVASSASAQSSSTPAAPKVNRTAELNAVLKALEGEIFDLSATPALLDAGEYASRQSKYREIVAAAAPAPPSPPVTSQQPPAGSDLASQFAQAAFVAGTQVPEYARAALSSIVGKAPIATEEDLVAFFSLKPAVVASSSSH